jgi:hypothetical protein
VLIVKKKLKCGSQYAVMDAVMLVRVLNVMIVVEHLERTKNEYNNWP